MFWSKNIRITTQYRNDLIGIQICIHTPYEAKAAFRKAQSSRKETDF